MGALFVRSHAEIISTVDLTGGIDLTVNFLSSIQIDALGVHADINLAAGAAVPTAVTRAEIITHLVTAFGAVMENIPSPETTLVFHEELGEQRRVEIVRTYKT